MTALPLLKPYSFNKRGYLYKTVRCRHCGKPVKRAVSDDLLGRDDPRLGNAYLHICCFIDLDALQEKSYQTERALRA